MDRQIQFNADSGFYEVWQGDELLGEFSDKIIAKEFITECESQE